MDLPTRQRRKQINLRMIEKIIILPLEPRMRLLLNLKHDVAGLHAGQLVALATELNLVAGLDAPIDVHVQHLALDNRLLATALLAAITLADRLALALAIGTNGLETLDHRAHLADHGLHTPTITSAAFLHGALLAAAALALGTDDALLQGEFGHLAAVDVLEGNLVDVRDGAGFLGAGVAAAAHAAAEHTAKGAAAAAEELAEEVLGCHAAAHAALLETLLAILVVELALLGVREDFVCVGEVLELFGCFRVVCVLVW